MRASLEWLCVVIAFAMLARSGGAIAQDEPPPEDRPRRGGWFDWGGGDRHNVFY